MKRTLLPFCFGLLLTFTSCSEGSRPEAQEANSSDEPSVVTKSSVDCDPLISEYEGILEDFKLGLQEMIDDEEIDADKMEDWSERADELSENIEARGEKELGIKCWNEFQEISERFENEIAPLAIKLAQIEMKNHGIDMDIEALMEQAQEE